MNPSDQEALVAARSIKASRRKWEVRSLSALAVGVAILFIYPLAVFCAILGFFVLCRNHSVECERHEITLRQFAKSRNWYREAQTVLRRVERQKRRVRFYSGASLILTDDITDRILSGDFTARTPPPTGEVPRKPNATSHIAFINNVNQVTPPRPTPSYITLPAFHAVLPWPTGDITTEKTPAIDADRPATQPQPSVQVPTAEPELPGLGPTAEEFLEGAARQVTGSVYERDPRARLACLNHHGLYCFVCGFDFSESYGELGKGFIHVHHLRPLSEIRSEYEVNPITDLIPVCPNCHAMLHRRSPPLQPESLRKHLKVMGRVRKGMTRNPNSVKPPKRKSSGEAVGDATGSLPDYYATLPPDRVPKAVGAARAWLNEGVNNPDLLAAEIDRLTPKARRFSDAFWSEFCKVDATFERKVDWHQVYQRLDVGSPATH